ncbi:thioredoxin family protein [Pedobacter sp. BAL39]|nr:thioredoxin family protein [Pedobacter sp. BAL39]
MENPEVVKAYARYQQKGFEVLGVALEREGARGAWINAIKEDGLPWTQVTDFRYWKGDVVKLYSVQYVPQNYLLDPEGKVIATNLRGEDLQRKLAKVFKGK